MGFLANLSKKNHYEPNSVQGIYIIEFRGKLLVIDCKQDSFNILATRSHKSKSSFQGVKFWPLQCFTRMISAQDRFELDFWLHAVNSPRQFRDLPWKWLLINSSGRKKHGKHYMNTYESLIVHKCAAFFFLALMIRGKDLSPRFPCSWWWCPPQKWCLLVFKPVKHILRSFTVSRLYIYIYYYYIS